jgi:DNA replication protein DnaC
MCGMSGSKDPSRPVEERLMELLLSFKVPTLARELVPRLRADGHGELLPLLLEIFELEAEDRRGRRTDRLRRASHLPAGKTLATLDQARLPRALCDKLRELLRGDFIERAVNVLCFGLPGTGKSHVACALGHALVEAGHPVLFTPTYQLVQELLSAKRMLTLPRALRKLDLFDLIILDDLGYVAQSPEEAEVLFTLMAERYERKSMLLTSNLVFSHWDRIFGNPMATAAAVDRLVHHSVILEFDVQSFRTQSARRRAQPAATATQGGDNYPLPPPAAAHCGV